MVQSGASLSSGNDVRIARWDGGSWTELDRVVAIGSAWNTGSTKLFFQSQTSVAAATTDTSYFIYFGYAGASSPPANADNVYEMFDDFSSPSLNTSKWATITPPGTSVQNTAGEPQISGTADPGFGQSVGGIRPVSDSWPAGVIMESSVRIVSQSHAGTDFFKLNFGLHERFMVFGNDFASSDLLQVPAFTPVATSTLVGQTMPKHRVSEYVLPGGLAGHSEDGTLIATTPGPDFGTYSAQFRYSPFDAGEPFDVRFDDVVIRKYVAIEPITLVDLAVTPSCR